MTAESVESQCRPEEARRQRIAGLYPHAEVVPAEGLDALSRRRAPGQVEGAGGTPEPRRRGRPGHDLLGSWGPGIGVARPAHAVRTGSEAHGRPHHPVDCRGGLENEDPSTFDQPGSSRTEPTPSSNLLVCGRQPPPRAPHPWPRRGPPSVPSACSARPCRTRRCRRRGGRGGGSTQATPPAGTPLARGATGAHPVHVSILGSMRITLSDRRSDSCPSTPVRFLWKAFDVDADVVGRPVDACPTPTCGWWGTTGLSILVPGARRARRTRTGCCP